MEWRGIDGKGYSDLVCTWHGATDAAQLPDGHGVVTYPSGSWEHAEGVMAAGRRQGIWVIKRRQGGWNLSGTWTTMRFCADEVERNSQEVRRCLLRLVLC